MCISHKAGHLSAFKCALTAAHCIIITSSYFVSINCEVVVIQSWRFVSNSYVVRMKTVPVLRMSKYLVFALRGYLRCSICDAYVNAEIHSCSEWSLESVWSKALRLQHAVVQVDHRTASTVFLACKFWSFYHNAVRFLANVNSSSRSLYVIGRPSVVCL